MKNEILIIFLFSFLGLLIYSNTFQNSFHFDDSESIVNNLSIRSLRNLSAIWGFWPNRFVTYYTLALNYYLNRLSLFGYHLFNLLFHIGAALCLYWLALITFSSPITKDKNINSKANLLASLAGLIFLAHPLQTEAVTYIIQRTTSLAGLFYLASLCFYIKWRLLKSEGRFALSGNSLYFCSLISALAAMFSKEMAITLPLTIMLYEFIFLKEIRGVGPRRFFIPFLILLAVIPSIMFISGSVNLQEMRRFASGPAGISSWEYFLTQFRVMATYLRLLFIPLNQNLDYDYPVITSVLQFPLIISFLLLVIIILIALRSLQTRRIISFSIFWFFLILLPESSIIPIQDVISEHRLYLPMAGFALFLVTSIYYAIAKKDVKLTAWVLLIIIGCFSILTYKRNFVWKDDFSLWQDVIKKSPRKARPYINLGGAYVNTGEYDRAIAQYNQALKISPMNTYAYNNRGTAFFKKGDLEQAISDYSQAMKTNPAYADVYYNLGAAYFTKGDYDKALDAYNHTIKINSRHADAYYNRGLIYFIRKDFDRAISDYNWALKINPQNIYAYDNRGVAYFAKGDYEQAINSFSLSLKIYPQNNAALLNRAIAYFYRRDYDKAWTDVRKMESLGIKVDIGFLEKLKKASEIEKE